MTSDDVSLVNVGVTTISVTIVLEGWPATSKIVSAISEEDSISSRGKSTLIESQKFVSIAPG